MLNCCPVAQPDFPLCNRMSSCTTGHSVGSWQQVTQLNNVHTVRLHNQVKCNNPFFFFIEDFCCVGKMDKAGKPHTRIIWSCTWSHDDRYFATGSRDKRVTFHTPHIQDALYIIIYMTLPSCHFVGVCVDVFLHRWWVGPGTDPT